MLAAVFAWSCTGSHDRGASGDASDAPVVDAGDPTATACEGVDAGAAGAPTFVDLNITASGFTELPICAVMKGCQIAP